jgi:hypothetical protein
MKRFVFGVVTFLILGLLLTSQAGCLLVAAAAGTGAGVAYVRGDLEIVIEAGPKEVADATERAFKAMEVSIISKSSSSLDGSIVGRTARDVKLEVTITGQSERVSKASIRAGTFGDAALQEHVASEIRKQLPSIAINTPSTQPSTRPAVVDVK